MIKYTDIPIIQRIALKGMMADKRNRPSFFKPLDHKYFDGLRALWLTSTFKSAVQYWLNN